VVLTPEGTVNANHVALNDFQKRLEDRLSAALTDLGVQVDSRRVGQEYEPLYSPQPETFVEITAGNIVVRIREDSVAFEVSGKGDYCELLDYSSVDALADALVSKLTQRLSRSR